MFYVEGNAFSTWRTHTRRLLIRNNECKHLFVCLQESRVQRAQTRGQTSVSLSLWCRILMFFKRTADRSVSVVLFLSVARGHITWYITKWTSSSLFTPEALMIKDGRLYNNFANIDFIITEVRPR